MVALLRPVLAPLLAGGVVLGAGCASGGPTVGPPVLASAQTNVAPPGSASTAATVTASPEPPVPLANPPTWEAWRRADVLLLAPHRFADALAPLVRHRTSQGHVVAQLDVEPLFARFSHGQVDARALQKAVRAVAAHAAEGGGKLHYVLLAGDFDEVPTFYLRKGAYEHHSAKEHDNPHAITREEHAAYPSDDPYARERDTDHLESTAPTIAVGRIPARSPEEVDAFVRKLVAYETAPLANADQSWRRRLTLYAGDPYFGPMGDELVRTVAEGILDQDLSYDFDLRLTFAKDTSPYAFGFDHLERKFASDMADGAIVAAYVGHGSVTRFAPAEFRGRRYEVGTASDAAEMRIAAGKPVFFSIACDTGAFDRPGGLPSLAEQMVLNPEGPVAVFASSRESHPYPNALYGQAIIRQFVNGRPATVGDGVVAVKDGMLRGSIPVAELLLGDDIDVLKAEHVGLYNLFGDPATRLRYPGPLTVTVGPAVARTGTVTVDVAAPSVAEGKVRVTLETRRGTLKGPLVAPSAMASMAPADAFKAMERNNVVANDKVVASVDGELHGGKARVTLRAPEAGDYFVKALATGADAAAGHADLHVAPGP